MFNETGPQRNYRPRLRYGVGLSDAAGELYRSLGWPSREAWKAAGRPKTPYPGGSVGVNPVVSPPVSNGSGSSSGGSTGAAGGTGTPPATGSAGGGLLSGIPTTYLLIGAAVVALMVLKK